MQQQGEEDDESHQFRKALQEIGLEVARMRLFIIISSLLPLRRSAA
jgi:hypothetical protein